MNGKGCVNEFPLFQRFIQSIDGTYVVSSCSPLVAGSVPPDLIGEHLGDQLPLLKFLDGKLVPYL